MIRTLVVDDDFQVARIHAASVERVPGFTCIGQAHTAAEASAAVSRDRPDLMILDIYLPDNDGLTLLRELTARGDAPDTIIISAARDVATVRSAMSLGAVYYLVKPFGFPALAQQLLAYQRWHEQLTLKIGAQADQETVDSMFNLLRPTSPAPAGRNDLTVTMAKVLQAVTTNPTPIGATDVAKALGISRPTAQRYLSELERRKLVQLGTVLWCGRTAGTPLPVRFLSLDRWARLDSDVDPVLRRLDPAGFRARPADSGRQPLRSRSRS